MRRVAAGWMLAAMALGTILVSIDSRPCQISPSAPTSPPAAPRSATCPSGSAARTGFPAAAPPRPGRRFTFFDGVSGWPQAAGDAVQISRRLLEKMGPELGLAGMPGELRETRRIRSLTGFHVRFAQVVAGVPVYGSEVSAHLAPDGRPLAVAADVFPLEGVTTNAGTSVEAARAAARDLLDPEGLALKPPRLVILPRGRTGDLVWLVDTHRETESLRLFLSAADLEPIRVEDRRRSYDGVGRIFDPNPVQTLRDPTLRDAGDRDSKALRAARRLVTLPRLDGTGWLRGDWVDLTATQGASRSLTLDWSEVDRADPAFEEVMAYYHIDRAQAHLRDLSITNVNAHPQSVDARGLRTDNSWFDPYFHRINLGTGGVDDGEDADIILHEYGHAIQEDQVPDFGLSDQGAAMGEGFADFFAADRHATGDGVWDPLVGSWDATSYSESDLPRLRRVDGDRRWPDDYVGEVHEDGRIWSGFLWELRDRIGSDEALRVVLESHFFLAPRSGFLDGANAILLANQALREGRDETTIRWLLSRRGIEPTVERAPLPPEEPSEPNDDPESAAPIPHGLSGRYLAADDDWFRIAAAADRRVSVRAIHDPRDGDLTLSILRPDGTLIEESDTLAGTASVSADAGPAGAEFLVRIRSLDGRPVAYDLSVTEGDLKALIPGRTQFTRVPGRRFALYVPEGVRLVRVVARRASRGGGLPALRIVDPGGGDQPSRARGVRRAVTSVRRPEAGRWIVEVGDARASRLRLRAVLR